MDSLRYFLLIWVAGAVAIYAAPDGLSTLAYLGVAAAVSCSVAVVYWMARRG